MLIMGVSHHGHSTFDELFLQDKYVPDNNIGNLIDTKE